MINISSFVNDIKQWYFKVTEQKPNATSEIYNFELSKEAQDKIKTVPSAPQANAIEEKRNIVTKELDRKINKRLNQTIDIIDSRPCFLKPAYLLQSATPHVSAKLVMLGGNEGILAYDFLPASELGRSQNIIKSFDYDVDTSTLKLSITDADQDIIEYIGYLFANVLLTNPPILEVEFGWSHHKEQEVIQGNYIQDPTDEVERNKIDTHVYFRRSIFSYVQDFESQYTAEGVLELTFTAQISQNFPPPYQHFLPYDLIGRNPAVSIQMIHTLFTFYNYFKNKTKIEYTDILFIAEFFFYEKHITEEKALSIIIHKTLKFFMRDGFQNNKDLIGDYNSAWMKKIDTDVATWKTKEDRNPISFETIRELNENITNTTNYYKNIEKIFKGNILESIESLRVQLKNMNNGEYSKLLRQYVMDLTPILNVSLIHPFDIIRYVEQCLQEQGKKYNFVLDKNLFIVQGFEDNVIAGYDYKRKTYINNKNLSRYLIKSGDILVNPTSSWDELFNSLATKCFVGLDKENYEVLNKNSGEEKKEEKFGKETKLLTSMTGNCFVLKKKEALFNLNTLKMILQAREADSNINKISNTDTTSIAQIKKAYNDIKKLDNNAWVVLVSYDVVPGMNNLFDPLNGKNQILQAYSYRAGNTLAFTDNEGKNFKQYNPGYPNVWSINFPDVLNFQPKFNFRNQVSNLANVMKLGMTGYKQQIEEAQIEKERLQNSIATEKNKEKQEEIKKEIETKTKDIEGLKKQQDIFDKYHGRMPYQNPALMMYEDPFIDISKHGEINNRRKKMQEFRKHAILSSVNIEADLEVLGDPIFNIHSKGKYLFLRYFTQLGDLSFFTGVYIINGIKHSISNGRYVTTFSLQKDATVGSTEVAEQIFRGFTENDNCYS